MSILVATDFSENTFAAVRSAAALARRMKKPLRLIHVVDFSGDDNAWRILYETTDEIERNTRKEALAGLERIVDQAIPANERPDEILFAVRFGEPGEGIIAEADSSKPDLIVLGTVGENRLQHIFFGRTANHLVRETAIPVLAVPPGHAFMDASNIVVGIDFSECSEVALQTAGKWADLFDANLYAIHAVDVDIEVSAIGHVLGDIGTRLDAVIDDQTKALNTMIENNGLAGQIAGLHVSGSRPDRAIQEQADAEEADLIVMGTHGRRGFARWFLGSTAERTLRSTERPVLVVSNP